MTLGYTRPIVAVLMGLLYTVLRLSPPFSACPMGFGEIGGMWLVWAWFCYSALPFAVGYWLMPWHVRRMLSGKWPAGPWHKRWLAGLVQSDDPVAITRRLAILGILAWGPPFVLCRVIGGGYDELSLAMLCAAVGAYLASSKESEPTRGAVHERPLAARGLPPAGNQVPCGRTRPGGRAGS